mgnify:CR=1 FL=1
MIPYAARTGTRRNLAELRYHEWRLLVSARGVLRTEGFPYALDNGAWTAFQRNEPFDERAFDIAVDRLGADADFIVVPDIVCGGMRSLEYSLSWLDRLRGVAPLVLAVQDGMTVDDLRPLLGPDVGVAVGGSTEWKESTTFMWWRLAREMNARCHVLRVNTLRRLNICIHAGATSFDGSSASRYSKTCARLTQELRRPRLFQGP